MICRACGHTQTSKLLKNGIGARIVCRYCGAANSLFHSGRPGIFAKLFGTLVRKQPT